MGAAPDITDGSAPVLTVDLDRELVPSSLVHEVAWAALARDRRMAWRLGGALVSGRAAVGRTLAAAGAPPLDRLPYDPEVLDRVRRWRADGGRTVLVTSFDRDLAEAVAGHLGLFDEVRLAEAGTPVPTRPSGRNHVRPLMRALRPHQWLKNLLVFVPLLAGHRLDAGAILMAVGAFLAFSLIASGVYVLNDLMDLDADRRHPRKRSRPFASGALPLDFGTLLAPGLFLAGFLIAALIGGGFVLVMLSYLAVTSAYSFDLKRRLIVDICTLAGLYTLRVAAGGVATGTPLSVWLLAFSIFFFFALAAVKRQAELVAMDDTGPAKAHGRSYVKDDLSLVSQMAVASGYISVLVMALYLDSDAVQALYPQSGPLWGICLILLYWISRTVMITHRGWMHDDPVVFAARDRNSQVCALVILGLAASASL